MLLDSTIIAALIGAVATIFATFLSPIISKGIERRKKYKFVPDTTLERKQVLYGKWSGHYIQKVGKPEYLKKHLATITFTEGDKDLKGIFTLSVGSNAAFFESTMINTIFDGRLFKTDFVNKDSHVVHFGTMYGEISANGKNITGHFLGYGLASEMFVSGDMLFTCER